MLSLAVLLVAGAVWRALVALGHYRSAITITNDPSIREFEQVNAFFEVGLALVLLIHGVGLAAFSRRPPVFRWPYTLGVGLACALIVSGSLLGASVTALPGAYPISIIVSVAILSHLLMFSWISLYLGAVIGSALACFGAAPAPDAFACLFVVVPCVAFAFVGAGVRFLYMRAMASSDSS